jgi:hypothetical protein
MPPGANILSAGKYDFTRELHGTAVPNKYEVALHAVAVPTSFALAARHEGSAQAAAEARHLRQATLLSYIYPFAAGLERVDEGAVQHLRAAFLAGGGVDESAPFYSQWKQLEENSAKNTMVKKSIVAGSEGGDGLFWSADMPWPTEETPLVVYGGFECKTPLARESLPTKAKDYLLHVPQTTSYVCGEPWEHMPCTHVGGRACCASPPDSRPCTIVKWINIEQLLPSTMRDHLREKKVLKAACRIVDPVPIVYSAKRRPAEHGELTLYYGKDEEAACPGIKRHRMALDENLRIQPSLQDPDESGVVAVDVPSEAAVACAAFLRERWVGGKLLLESAVVTGYGNYGKTISNFNSTRQAENTLLIKRALLPLARQAIPGFQAMEDFLKAWLNKTFGGYCELYFAHGLRQSKRGAGATDFDVHQDTEEFDEIEYTVVVKLSFDKLHAAPSEMRVVGAQRNFAYGAHAGASGAFRARLHHASVEPSDWAEHLKLAFFFTSDPRAERANQRLARQDEGS